MGQRKLLEVAAPRQEQVVSPVPGVLSDSGFGHPRKIRIAIADPKAAVVAEGGPVEIGGCPANVKGTPAEEPSSRNPKGTRAEAAPDVGPRRRGLHEDECDGEQQKPTYRPGTEQDRQSSLPTSRHPRNFNACGTDRPVHFGGLLQVCCGIPRPTSGPTRISWS